MLPLLVSGVKGACSAVPIVKPAVLLHVSEARPKAVALRCQLEASKICQCAFELDLSMLLRTDHTDNPNSQTALYD